MASRFIFTEEAETQLLEILDHLADESESAAVRVRDAVYDAVGKLAESPRHRPHARRPDQPATQVLECLLVSHRL